MTLQSSPPISIGDVANELGIGLPLSLGDSRVLALAGLSAPPISLGNLLGKSSHFSTNVNVTSSQQHYTYPGGGTVGYSFVISKIGTSYDEFILLADGGALSKLLSFTYDGTTHNGPFSNNQQVTIYSGLGGAPGNVTITLNF